jgi:3-oxoacyl-[acyl-carrier protein] reductase
MSHPQESSPAAMPNTIVTGASRGLGLAIAQRLTRAGHDVIAIARRETPELAAAIAAPRAEGHGRLSFAAVDLGDTAGMRALIGGLVKSDGPITGLVNNAGLGTPGVLANMRDRDIEALVRLNTLSPMVLTRYVVRAMMVAGGGGRIVNIASIVAFSGFSGLSAYSATKASLIGFTRSLARETGPLGITVNAVAPGFIDTAMTEDLDHGQRDQIARRSALKRLADPDDVASAVAYLMSPEAKNITGTVLTVDAGGTA